MMFMSFSMLPVGLYDIHMSFSMILDEFYIYRFLYTHAYFFD